MLQKWLESVGLAHVVADFEAHWIELADLKTLTEDDLREIGLAIGDRKRFRSSLDAAPATAATCRAPTADATSSSISSAAPRWARRWT